MMHGPLNVKRSNFISGALHHINMAKIHERNYADFNICAVLENEHLPTKL